MVDSGSFASSHSSSVGFCQNPRVCRAPRHLNRGPLLYSFLHARCWFSRRSENSTTLDSPSKVSSSRPPPGPLLLQRHSTSWVACPGSPVAMSLHASNALAFAFCPYSARGVASAGPGPQITALPQINARWSANHCTHEDQSSLLRV